MKKQVLYVLLVAWGWSVLYLLGSFTAASFDVMQWASAGRFLVAMLAGLVATLGAILCFADL